MAQTHAGEQVPWMFSHPMANASPTGATPLGQATHDEPLKPRRARTVVQRPRWGYCRTCRRRKVKCDERRPFCGRCRSSGRNCEGYDSWQVDVETQPGRRISCGEDIRTLGLLTARIDDQSVNQVQLFADLLSQHYRNPAPAAPAPAHIMSFLHYLASNNVAPPLLRNAIDSLCWAHLAKKFNDLCLIQRSQDSQTRLLSVLQRAVAHSESDKRCYDHRDVLATILVISLIPSPIIDNQSYLENSSSFRVHFNGATQYLHAHGPAAFAEGNAFDLVLLRHIRMQAIFQHLGRRKEVLWNRPEWRMVDSMPFAYIPVRVMLGFVARLPGLLERADTLMANNRDKTESATLMYTSLILKLDDIQRRLVQPWLVGETLTRPLLLNASHWTLAPHSEAFDVITANVPFTSFYEFSKPSHGFCNAYVHLMSLVSDCTLLQLIDYRATGMWTSPGFDPVSFRVVELRAYASALELCRYTYFFASRSLPAVIFLSNVLQAARNFFECYDKWQEMDWCNACLLAVTMRLERMKLASPYILCPVGDLVASVPAACRYGPRANLNRQDRVIS